MKTSAALATDINFDERTIDFLLNVLLELKKRNGRSDSGFKVWTDDVIRG